MLTTLGQVGAPGFVGLDECGVSDNIVSGRFDRPSICGVALYKAPFPGGVITVLGESQGVLVVDNGGHQMKFTLATASFES